MLMVWFGLRRLERAGHLDRGEEAAEPGLPARPGGDQGDDQV